jgi:hypothetical protein
VSVAGWSCVPDFGRQQPAGHPPPIIVTVHLGEPETGIWCPHCLLPSAVSWPVVADKPRLFPAGVTVTICQDCGANLGEG